MPVLTPSTGEIPEIPNGLYRAEVKAVEGVHLETPDQFGKTEKLVITVEFEAEGEIQTLKPWANQAWSENATLFKIVQACGLDPNPYEAFDTDNLIGRHVNVLVETAAEGKWPRVTKWSRISNGRTAPSVSPTVSGAMGRITAFWTEARKLGDKDAIYRKVEALTGGEGIAGMSQAELDALLARLKGSSGKKHMHDPAYDAHGVYICRDCGEKLEEPTE